MKSFAFNSIILALLSLIIFSCAPKRQTETGDYAAYIKSFTQGTIHAEMPLTIEFSKPVGELPESFLPNELLFTLKPEVKGKTIWLDQQTVQFVPDEALKHNATYEVTFFLNKVMDVPVDFHLFRYNFATYPILFEIESIVINFDSKDDDGLFMLEGAIRFSDEVMPENYPKIFACEYEGKKQPIEFETADNLNVRFAVRNLIAQDTERKLLFLWNGKPIESPLNDKIELSVPSQKTFEVFDIKIEGQGSATPEITVSFNKPLLATQNLEGLIGFSEAVPFTYRLQNNSIHIYPEMSGAKKEAQLFLASGIKSAKGQSLQRDFKQAILFEQIAPEARFVGKGTILAEIDNNLLPFQVRGLRAVDVHVIKVFQNNMLRFLQNDDINESMSYNLRQTGRLVSSKRIVLPQEKISTTDWKTHAIDLSKLISENDHALYRVSLTFDKSYAVLDCNGHLNTELQTETFPVTEKTLKPWSENGYYSLYNYPYDFNWNERENPCTDSYYYYQRFPSKNVFVSNIGIIAKNNGKKGISFFVNDIRTTDPLRNAKVQLFDYQLQIISEGTTDSEGHVLLKSDLTKPFIAFVTHNGQGNYLKLGEGKSLPMSRFDVSGEEVTDGLKAFIFTERDVYMPGDTLFVSVMLHSKNESMPKQQPLMLEMRNAQNQIVKKETQITDKGLNLFKIPTDAAAPTGLWTAKVSVGGQDFSKRIAVETIKPNRLKVSYDFAYDVWKKSDLNKSVSIHADWLHGAPASDAAVTLTAYPAVIEKPFEAYKDYLFSDNSRWFDSYEFELASGKTDAQGNASFKMKMPDFKRAKGMLNLTSIARVMTQSGDVSTVSKSFSYAPFDTFLGLKTPESNDRYHYTDVSYRFDVVALSADGKPKEVENVVVEIFKTYNSWWWSGNENSEANFVSTSDDERVFTQTIALKNGKASFEWQLAYPNWGAYYVRVTDRNGGHAAGTLLYFDWPSGYARDGRDVAPGANLLSLTLDKQTYKPGETAKLSFPSFAGARALVTIESGDKILKKFWKDLSDTESMIEILIEESYAPNVYVGLTMLQNAKKTNDLPIRLYGVIPLFVDAEKSKLSPILKMPQTLQPEKSYTIEVNETSGKSMSYVLFVVDEGLLDVTNFKTPDPYKAFFKKESLGLKTWDLYDQVMGAFGGKIDQLFAVGGGDMLAALRDNAMKTRFKPVVSVLGPFYLEAGQTAKHDLKMTNYVGSVKAMVVATSGDAFGKADQTAKVKKPLMLLASAPRFLRPDDVFSIPVTLFSDLKTDGKATVKISLDGTIEPVGAVDKQVSLKAIDEKIVAFELKAPNKSGSSKIRIEAQIGNEKAYDEIELSVNNPNNLVYNTESKLLQPGEESVHQVSFFSEEDFRSLNVSLSYLPVPNMQSRIDYLVSYPYGCLEQIAAKAFAQLYLNDVFDLSDVVREKQQVSIRLAIQKITQQKTIEGRIPYWASSNYINEWAELFAGHFMQLAFAEGYPVSETFITSWRKAQENLARKWEPLLVRETLQNDELQAYRLYVLSLMGKPMMAQMNRLRENVCLTKNASLLLANAYLLSGKERAARELLYGRNDFKTNTNSYETFGSDMRSKAFEALAYLAFGNMESAFENVKTISEQLGSNEWLSTQSTAFGLFAYQEYVRKQGKQSAIVATIRNYGETIEVNSSRSLVMETIPAKTQRVAVANKGNTALYVQIQQGEQPYVRQEKAQSNKIALEVTYYDKDEKKLPLDAIKKGTTFYMKATIRNLTDSNLTHLALNQVIAGGWEILNNRIYIQGTNQSYTFQDVRHDRVNTFFDLKRGEEKTFACALMATYAGSYYLPQTTCEAMYDNEIYARSVSLRTKVIE